MEAEEMCEWFETLIEDLIEEYKWDENNSLEWCNGAIEALEKLLRKVNEE